MDYILEVFNTFPDSSSINPTPDSYFKVKAKDCEKAVKQFYRQNPNCSDKTVVDPHIVH